MAKKKDKGLSYLQVPLPQGQGYYRIIVNWTGLNKTQKYDAGVLSDASNICIDDPPYLSAVPEMREFIKAAEFDKNGDITNNGNSLAWLSYTKDFTFIPYPYARPLSIHAFDGCLAVIYEFKHHCEDDQPYDDTIFIDLILHDKIKGTNGYITMADEDLGIVLTGVLDNSEPGVKNMAQFNRYENIADVIGTNVYPRLIILPDKKSFNKQVLFWQNGYTTVGGSTAMSLPSQSDAKAEYVGYLIFGTVNSDFDSVDGHEQYKFFECYRAGNSDYRWTDLTYKLDETGDEWVRRFFEPSALTGFPSMDYATANQGRLFGVGDGRVFVSGYNNYANWNLDTADEYNESNAWCSPAQSNIKADKDFTGIVAFKNHVVCFKKNFIHEIYNTKNPFRLVDVFSEGAIDNRSICEVNGNLIFVSENSVMVYTGSTPKKIGYELGIEQFEYAVAGTDERRYYLYCRGTKGNEDTEGFFVYDTFTGVWTQRSIDIIPNSDCEKVIGFAHNNKGMFMLGGDGRIYRLDTGKYGGTEWSFETDLITRQSSSSSSSSSAYTSVNIKHVKKIQMLTELIESETGEIPYIKVWALYDGEKFDSEKSQLVYDSNGKTGVLPVRIKLRKSAHYGVKLHVEGKGQVRLYNMELFMEKGGDLYV